MGILKKHFLVIFSIFCLTTVAHAIDSIPEGWRVIPNTTKTVNTKPIGGDCKKVANNEKDRFIPTKSLPEWNLFKTAAPSLGVSLSGCGGTAWSCGYSAFEQLGLGNTYYKRS